MYCLLLLAILATSASNEHKTVRCGRSYNGDGSTGIDKNSAGFYAKEEP